MSLRWEDADYAFPAAGLDCFLLWAAGRGASDVSFQTGAPAFIEIDGILCRATGAVLDGVVIGRLVARVFDDTGEGILRSGRAIDCSYAVASGPPSVPPLPLQPLAGAGRPPFRHQPHHAGAARRAAHSR